MEVVDRVINWQDWGVFMAQTEYMSNFMIALKETKVSRLSLAEFVEISKTRR
jgi:hypothetical protein